MFFFKFNDFPLFFKEAQFLLKSEKIIRENLKIKIVLEKLKSENIMIKKVKGIQYFKMKHLFLHINFYLNDVGEIIKKIITYP